MDGGGGNERTPSPPPPVTGRRNNPITDSQNRLLVFDYRFWAVVGQHRRRKNSRRRRENTNARNGENGKSEIRRRTIFAGRARP